MFLLLSINFILDIKLFIAYLLLTVPITQLGTIVALYQISDSCTKHPSFQLCETVWVSAMIFPVHTSH